MDEKQTAKALFKKLSALRATLSDDEQALLDALVQGEYEATAHGMTAKAATGRVYQDADEAAAHGMTAKASAGRVTHDADEAAAHGMTAKAATGRVYQDAD
ncbi:MAG TPA: hypothetical protein PK829_08585, partial [Promineifilum sp.]|nr:hypothetical protein [Promineifilum sp.]